MQSVKLNPNRIVDRHGSEVDNLPAQGVHARHDPELRDERECQHQAQEHVAASEYVRGSVSKATVEQGADKKDNAGNDGNPVQLAERSSDDIACEMRARQNLKRGRSKHESKEDQPADPTDERQKHEKTQE